MPTSSPTSVLELCELVRQARASQTPLFPRGGGTMQHYGLPATRSGTDVDLTGLHQVIDYPARDMTITVQAGLTLRHLQDLLQKENQRLPIDVPLPETATLGGAIAANASGARRFGCGTFRDYVIGISAVNDEGQEFKAGGRVVKNVAGYDLCKLFTGSFGTLGILTQITLKVRPCAEASALVGVACTGHRLGELLDMVHRTQTRPNAVEVLSPLTASELLPADATALRRDLLQGQLFLLLLGFEDNAEAVRWQVQQSEQEFAPLGVELRGVWNGMEHALWAALRDYPLQSFPVTFQANIPSSHVAEFCRLVLPLVPRLQAHAGNGVVLGHGSDHFTLEHMRQLRGYAESHGGSLLLHRCPEAWRTVELVWGTERGDVALMRQVKAKFDPQQIFNPGRFVTDSLRCAP
jgi:glycolate oxidase FAD binding subunit